MSSEKEYETPGSITDSPVLRKNINEILINLGKEKKPDEVSGDYSVVDDDSYVETLDEGVFTWHIDNWEGLTNDKYISPRYKIGQFEWNLLLFPQGNHNKSLAIYLEPHAEEVENEITGKLEPVDPDWYCCAQFAVVLSKPGQDDEIHVVNRSHHRFNATDTDWGFANFVDLNILKNQVKDRPSGLINDGQINLTIYVRILKDPTGVLWHNFVNYDSKKITGYVGFRNQGATCYLNSLLQSYYSTKYFRKLVYKIPTENENPNDSVPLALQRAFYQLQVSKFPLDTLELTRSFGWDSADAFTQHDVQELNRILMDRLEYRMKGTQVEGKLNSVFVGKMKSYIKCKNVDYESSRVEDYWDIQLNVKGMKNLQESFQNYIEVELMDGENQYAAPDFGLQDAFKGVVFESFPNVLHLQLKRFEYDFNYDQLIKVNDRYAYPDSINLSPYMDKNLLEENPGPHVYKLHGVLVHTGDISTGHYYTMIKPSLENQWYRFDDDKVWKVGKKQVFDENFGLDRLPDSKLREMTRDEYQNYLITRHTSAYMLVYIKEDKEEETLQKVDECDVPEHVVQSIKKENSERELREREIKDAHLYVNIRVHSIKNFIHYQGFDLSPNVDSNLYDEKIYDENSRSISLKVPRNKYLKDLYKNINETLGIPHGKNVRYWRMDYRKNGTLRLETPVISNSDAVTLEEAIDSKDDEVISPIDIFVEEPYLELKFLEKLKQKKILECVTLNDDLIDNLRTNVSKLVPTEYWPVIEDITNHELLFIKVFDLEKQQLLGYGHFISKKEETVSRISDTISNILETNSILQLYEELNPGEIYSIQASKQLFAAELITGDILAFQLPNGKSPELLPKYDTIADFYNFLRYRVKLCFTKTKESSEDYVLETSSPEKFDFWVSAHIPYQELSRIVSQYTEVDAGNLKVFAIYPNAKYTLKSDSFLKDYLIRDYNCELIPTFEYETLSLPLKELECLKSIKLYWLKENYIHYQVLEFKISANFTVKEFLDKIQSKLDFSDEDKVNIMIWTNNNYQFETVLFEDNTFDEIGKSHNLFARILPEETKLLKQIDYLESMEDEEHDYSSNDMRGEICESDLIDNNIEGKIVIVMQYFKEQENKHGISFLFNILPDENLVDTKVRLHEKFGLGQKEFSKIKLSLVIRTNGGKVLKSLYNFDEENERSLVLYDLMENLDCILMDHPDRLKSQATHDRPMTIK